MASEMELPELAGASGVVNGLPLRAHELEAVYNIPVTVSVVLGKGIAQWRANPMERRGFITAIGATVAIGAASSNAYPSALM